MDCWICGKTATTTRPILRDQSWFTPEPSEYRRSYCDECMKRLIKAENEERRLYIKLKKKQMFLKACKILEGQETNMYEYKDAIEVVQSFMLENPDKFDSSYEVLTAIILVHNRIHSIMQYKVGKYQVDFYLPEMLVVLEVDGERHRHRKEYDSRRDKSIKNELGPHWEIIRLKTEYLDKNAKLIPEAIDKALEYRETKHVNWRALQE